LTAPSSTTRSFFDDVGRFGDAPALIDAASGATLAYGALAARLAERRAALGPSRHLVFLEAGNDVTTVLDYLACLSGGHVVHPVADLEAPQTLGLIERYRPDLALRRGDIRVLGEAAPPLHPDLRLLLSTSGSTGSPKLVKLSAGALAANATAVAASLALSADERAMHHLKLHYSYGLSVIHSHLAVGAALVLTERAVNEAEFWRDFDARAATSFAGVPYSFETLGHLGFDPAAHPSLRYATQAGGRLAPDLVVATARAFAAAGKRFYVMYGQTEAAPRISCLPPELAIGHPGSIGRALPGGRLSVIDDAGRPIAEPDTPGELVYEGPNIMMGYATDVDGLATDETPPRLFTGDLAAFDVNGLFRITGRASRLVKPFGVRVNLDDIEAHVRARHADAVVAGDDRTIVVALAEPVPPDVAPTPASLAREFRLPEALFTVRRYAALPRLPNGKTDYPTVLADVALPAEAPSSLFRRIVATVVDVLGLRAEKHASVEAAFRSVLGGTIDPDASFRDQALDSLAFVALAIALEELFGDRLPDDWQVLTLRELEERHQQQLLENL
jgi:acyl-CoA synthetase (AMP-forming)/AMP-acid ligase II/acyl carrier protein